MSIFDKHIKLRKVFQVTALNNRATARKLVEKINRSWANTVILDFEYIEFASRSFLDELNSHLPHIDKEIKKVKMNASVKEMGKIVQKPKATYSNSETEPEPELHTF